MAGTKARKPKQYTVPNTEEVYELVTRIVNKYSRAVVVLHPKDDSGPMDAGLPDAPLFTASLHALDDRLDPDKPEELVAFVDQHKKKRGPDTDTGCEDELAREPNHNDQASTPPRKRVISAVGRR